ncbi:MAG TPA: DEAD/DEAH box helicase [Thermoanaerobaculia bacterium]|nr:DEAD/DEAH box helicase [Thermoanaerobaculia bacterium]
MSTLTLHDLVVQLGEDRDLGPQIAHSAYLPGHPREDAEPDPPLPEPLRAALAELGVERLFSHQVAGFEAARAHRDVLVTTPTASGKSLIFQLPVLEEALAGGEGRALFLFPLKALGQDQRAKLDRLAAAAGLDPEVERAAIYDGDTPRAERERIRAEPPRVVISNPDMVHLGMLAHAASWQPLLSRLRWIVLDELHTYRGIFGCHFYHVLQRLLRLCRRYGADPAIVASSATAANAAEFAQRLSGGRDFVVVDRSGAPREGRHFLLLQPETSPYTTALHLLIACLRSGLKTIVFTKARRITELLHSWLARKEPELALRVANYRAGFLAEERREIERALFEGRLDGVISTSALEMGIDVGGLDACILVGFPGSMMATWQRAGRVGRADRESLTALVALPDALDQYLLRQPEQFLGRACEPLIVSPENRSIGARHLVCAAAEMPLERERDAAYLERHAALVGDLLRDFALAEEKDGGVLHALEKAPHRAVSLRGGGASFTITSELTGRSIGTVDGARVLRECHPGAVYLHAGRQYGITALDPAKRQALARPLDVDFFTSPLTEKNTEILELLDHRSDGPLHAWLGRVRVTEWVVGFERKRIQGQERLGQEALELPPLEMETVALWLAAPRAFEETLREAGEDFMGALHAAEHAAISLFPVLALCDRGDLGGISIPFHPQVGSGAVFVYDGHEGGVGICETGFARLPELLGRVEELLAGCGCEEGCPACIQSPKCGNGNRPLDKDGAARLVRLLLGREAPIEALEVPEPDLGAVVDARAFSRVDRSSLATTSETPPGATLEEGGHPAGGHSRDLFDLGEVALSAATRAPSTVSDPAGVTSAPPPPGARPRLAPPPYRAPLPRTITRTVLFDVETKRSAEEVGGWHRLHRLGVALAVTCALEDGVFRVFREDQVGELAEELRGADLVVGFNVIGFDYPVLSGYLGEDFRRTLPTLDLFESVRDTVGERLGLSRLARDTLGVEKSADGLQSLEWYRQSRFDLIEAYCRRDVELLRDLYLFGRREGFVCWRDPEDRVVRIPVEWP